MKTAKWTGGLIAALIIPTVMGLAAHAQIAHLDNGVYYTDGQANINNLLHLAADRYPVGEPVDEYSIHMSVTGDGSQSIEWWMHAFDLVVVVDKASDVQTLWAYKNVGDPTNPKAKLIMQTKVSTGIEQYGCNPEFNKADGSVLDSRKFFGQTPTGFYPIFLKDSPYHFASDDQVKSGKYLSPLQIDYWSSKYEDGHMAYAVFFIPEEGIATHVHNGGGFGHRHSHGCVRMQASYASRLFEEVLKTGGPIDPNGRAFKPQCNPDIDPSRCAADMKSRVKGYETFMSKAIAEAGKENRPYTSFPKVPAIDRNGNCETDPKDPSVKCRWVSGYRTLYIVEDTGMPSNFSVSDVRCPTRDEIVYWHYNPAQPISLNDPNRPPMNIGPNDQYQDQYQPPQRDCGIGTLDLFCLFHRD